MRFGICCGPGSFAPEGAGDALAGISVMMRILEKARVDYLEFSVGQLSPEGPEDEFEKLRRAMAPYPIRVEAFNCFIPAHHRITGPDVDVPKVLSYCREALRRCRVLGGQVVVLGSAGARKLPEGFDPAFGLRQFVAFCAELGPVADEIGIDIAIEPLNWNEDNLINTIEQGIRVVDVVHHPRIRLLADLYHITQNREPIDTVAAAGSRLAHVHVADQGREAPGFGDPSEADFIGLFRSLHLAGYDARCSYEGKMDAIAERLAPLIAHLRCRNQGTAERTESQNAPYID